MADAFTAPQPPQHGFQDMLGGKKPLAPPGPNVLDLSGNVTDIDRRMRILEERFLNLRQKTQVIEQNIIHHDKKLYTEIKTTNTEIFELKREIDAIKNKFLLLSKEVSTLAKKEDVDVLNKYISMWDPMKFVTRKEVSDIIDEKMNDLLNKS